MSPAPRKGRKNETPTEIRQDFDVPYLRNLSSFASKNFSTMLKNEEDLPLAVFFFRTVYNFK